MNRPDATYEPPANDPRDEGRQHWDRIRSELMVTRDALRTSEIDRETQARVIDQLKADNKKLAEDREIDRNECVALKTSLHVIGRLIVAVLQRGAETRKNGDAYAPPAGGTVDSEGIDAVARNIEDLLANAGKTKIPDPPSPIQ